MAGSSAFGAKGRSLLVGLVGATALAGCNLLFGVDDSDLPPQSMGGASTGAGTSGASGEAGAGGAGRAGAPSSGSGGAGGGSAGDGVEPCTDDPSCSTKAEGSLCIVEACTKAAAECDKATLAVVPKGFAGAPAADLANACYHRTFEAAFRALVADKEARLVVHGETLTVPTPLTLPAGLTLEGRAADATKAVALTVTTPEEGAPLVTLAAESGLKGFALDGAGLAAGVKGEGGVVRLDGPLTIANTTRAFDLVGTVDGRVSGKQGAAIVLSGNQVGIVVGGEAKLALAGDGAKGGVTIEGTTQGAGVLVLAGVPVTDAVQLEGLWARGNRGSGADGTGAVEVRHGRFVTVSNGLFEGNLQALTLNGEGSSVFSSFSNVRLLGNRFVLQPTDQGSVICGSELNTQTQLRIGVGNVFPSGGACPEPPVLGCGGGVDVGSDTANQFVIASCG